MHELAIVQEVLAAVTEAARGEPVRRVVLEIGRLSGVLPEAVRFGFELCVEDGPLAGARLDIVEVPGRARCRGCGADVELDRAFGLCACGRSDLEVLSGEELQIREIEVS